MDLSSLNKILGTLAPILLVVGMVEMLPTGIDLPVAATHVLLAAIGCFMAAKG